MRQEIFENIYKFASIPVLVCEDDKDMTVFFANAEARLLLAPSFVSEKQDGGNLPRVPLNQYIHFTASSDQDNIRNSLKNSGSISRYPVQAENMGIPLTLSANMVQLGKSAYIVVYAFAGDDNVTADSNDILASVLSTTYHATDVDYAIKLILANVGEYINVSRVYVFEDLFNNHVRNTYEWCAPDVESVIDTLQNVCKDDYHHDVIINPSGLYVADDLRTLPEIDRAVLEPQGVKAIAILPLFHKDDPIGYIGYDDCRTTRKWTHKELTLLKGISSIISSLIIRRNAEADIKYGRETLQTISDNIEPIIYVNDLETYELKFVNRSLAEMLGTKPEQLVGQTCWKVLQKDMTGPCPFCPVPKLFDNGGTPGTTIEWEHQNTISGVWYWVKDSIIKWVDGTSVHFETAIDVTLRKKYEKQLQHYASTDALTGVFNREWGTKLLRQEHKAVRVTGISMSLCFLDLDRLKGLNDAFGHEAGDAAIINVCNTIRGRIRKDDLICRWGGDEFVILLKCETERAHAIMQGIQEELIHKDACGIPQLMFSYGIVDFTAADTVEDAIAVSDKIMYENKNSKRAR